MMRNDHFFVRLSSLAFLVALLIFILCAVGFGQATQPSANLIRRADAVSPVSAPANPPAGALNLPRVAGSLAVVIALIYATRWTLKKILPAAARADAPGTVQVLWRTAIGSRQNVIVLQVGRRLIVVGDSGQQLSALCQITDEDESSALLAQLRRERGQPASKTFAALLGRAAESFRSNDAGADQSARVNDPARLDESAHLDDPAHRNEIQRFEHFALAEEPGAVLSGEPSASVDETELGLATTRQELDGLLEKVREMRQTLDHAQ